MNGEVVSPTRHLRSLFKNTVITNQGYDFESGNWVIESGDADLVAFGKLFLANPDLPGRFATGSQFNQPNVEAFYAGDEHGYIDYPTLEEINSGKSQTVTVSHGG